MENLKKRLAANVYTSEQYPAGWEEVADGDRR